MRQCKCGSYACNDREDVCDLCWRDAEIERLRAELAEAMKAARIIWGGCTEDTIYGWVGDKWVGFDPREEYPWLEGSDVSTTVE